MTSSNANHVNILVRKDYRPVNVHVIGDLFYLHYRTLVIYRQS